MRNPLLVAAMGLSLLACSEKPPEKAAVDVYLKASASRPAAIQSTQDLPDVCWLDTVNDQPVKEASISDKSRVKLSGWAANIHSGTSPQQVFVEFDGPGKAYVQAVHGLKRPDVAETYKKPGLADSGWAAYANLSEIKAGAHKVRVILVEGQTGLVCDSKHSVTVK